jgi:hypothetical protein
MALGKTQAPTSRQRQPHDATLGTFRCSQQALM